MNETIFLLYLSEVATNLQVAFAMTMFFGTVTGIITYLHGGDEGNVNKTKRVWKPCFLTAIICVPLAIFTPGKTVFLTMAGLEAGETVMETDLGQKTIRLLEQKIDEELKANEN